MKTKGFIFLLLMAILLILQACTPAPTSSISENDQVATAVSQTLTAVTVIPTPTLTPVPANTVTPTPTPAPGPLRVVYSRAGSIWIWEEGGQPKQLTNNIVDARPRISDDGKLVVFERNNELYAVNSDGSNLHVLVSDQFLQDYLPSGYKFIWAEFYDWMPNSHLLYFSTKTGISGPMTDIYEYDLFRANVDTGEVRQIIAPGSGGVPYFSTDGQTIALVQARAINLANEDGSEVRKVLSFEPIYTWSEWIYLPVALPLPDGSGFRVAISIHGPPAGPPQPPEFWEIPNTGQASLLYSFVNPEYLGFRNLSPNGENIVYGKSKADQNSQICLHKNGNTLDDCWFQQGINGAFINWSPDSIHFVTADYSEENKLNFYLTDVGGNSIPINTYYCMYWVDTNRYFYVDKDMNLFLASINGDQTKIDKGIVPEIGKVDIWTWPFDFSD